jgi:hypothetical protein
MSVIIDRSQPASVRATTFVVPPFLIAKDGALTGFSIDLWNEIDARFRPHVYNPVDVHRRSRFIDAE